MKAFVLAATLLSASVGFASENNPEPPPEIVAARKPICTGVKILGVVGNGENVDIVYDLSEAKCQPGRIWTQEDYQAQQGGN